MRIAVAGGTRLVGSKVVAHAETAGHDVVVLSRAHGVDLTTGKGLAERLAGLDVVVDTTSTTATAAKRTVPFFRAVAENLQAASEAAGVRRIVTLSIVGIDGLGGGLYGHYDGKRAQEAATEAGSVPTTVLRATQFHDFAGQVIDLQARAGVLPMPRTPVQTVDVDVVAQHLVRLASEPRSEQRARHDLAGPEKRLLGDLVRATARARGKRLLVLPAWLPGKTPRRIREGALLAPPGAVLDGSTFDAWLERR